MARAANVGFPETVLVDYRSPDGPTVTHVRGGVIVSSLGSLKRAGVMERYLAELDARYRDELLYALAASWLPLEVGLAHVRAVDALNMSDELLAQSGEAVGTELGQLIYSTVMKAARSMGATPGWLLLRQADRLLPRVYRGGGCTVVQTGPKDALLELHGMPMVSSRFFRLSHQAYMKSLGRLMSEAVYVKPAHPRERHPHRIATAFSWV